MKPLLILQPQCAIFWMVLLFCLPLSSKAQDWTFSKEKDGVKIYKRKTQEGYELKLVSTFQTSLSAFVALFNNVPEYPRWGYKVQGTTLLKRFSDQEFVFYQYFDSPWPISDRDVIMHTKIWQDPNTRVVVLSSYAQPDYIPEKTDRVRIRKAKVQWTLTPLDNKTVQAVYCLNTDPGGILPDWSVNLASDIGPVQTVQNLKKILAESRYQDAQVSFIR